MLIEVPCIAHNIYFAKLIVGELTCVFFSLMNRTLLLPLILQSDFLSLGIFGWS